MAKKMWVSLIVYFTIFSWTSADEITHFKVISDGNTAILNCPFSEYAATIKIVTVDFNSTVCNDTDEDIIKEVSNLCHNKVKCEFELTDLIKDHNSACSSNESTAQLGITYHCSDPFTMQYLEGDVAMLTCSDEYNETIQLSSVLYNYSTCIHSDKYGIQSLCDGHTSCSFNITNSNVGSSCGADGKASLQVSYNCKRNGGWSNWTRNSTCSVTCGGGIQLYTRSCTNPSTNVRGASCVGESYYEEVCNKSNCVYYGIACLNSQLNWNCPGGYLQVDKALWETHNKDCRYSSEYEYRDAKANLQNKCNNKTTCDFTATNSSLNVSCKKPCTGLDYIYKCINASLILSEHSSIDVNSASEYVITISCTDGRDTTFFNLTLLLTTDTPDTQSDTILIIIGAAIGGLFLIVVIIVVCVRKRQHKNKYENRENEQTLQLSNIDGSSDGATPIRYSPAKGFDVMSHDNCGYTEVVKVATL